MYDIWKKDSVFLTLVNTLQHSLTRILETEGVSCTSANTNPKYEFEIRKHVEFQNANV